MKSGTCVLLGLLITGSAGAQSAADQKSGNGQRTVPTPRRERGSGGEIGSGAGAIGTGAAKGAGNLGKGTAKGARDLVTLHPINAAASVGKGAGAAGKDVTIGTVKSTARITKGVAKGLKKLF